MLPKDKRVCDAEGPRHEFEVSLFFWESQGRMAPHRCLKHTDDDVSLVVPEGAAVSSSAVQKPKFWEKLKNARKSIRRGNEMI